MAPDTYGDILARNIRAARNRIDIGQERLAARMKAQGFEAWIRQTVGATERGRRRPTAEEIVGLAFALETTAARLMAPSDDDPEEVELQPGVRAIPSEWIRASVMTTRRVGEIAWQGDNAIRKVPIGSHATGEHADFAQDLLNRISTGRPLPGHSEPMDAPRPPTVEGGD